MLRRRIHKRWCACGLAALALWSAPAAAAATPAGSQDELYRAYYLEHEEADQEGALALYRQVAADQRADPATREKARTLAAPLAEDLVARDFARLVPADTIFYAELSRPGEQLGALLSKLGLVAEDGAASGRIGISPALLSGFLGLRGAAVAITGIDPSGGPPRGVLIVHPGDLELLRGLVETALPASGVQVDPIAGYPTWNVEGQGLVALTSRLIVAGNDPLAMEGVLRRVKGEQGGSLAESAALSAAMADRGRDVLFFCANAKPVLPMLQAMLQQQSGRDPQAAMAMGLLDVQSLVGVAGRLAVDGEGLALDLSLHLAEGHHNVVFDLLRMPSVQRRTLELVPEGAAFFFATALNEPAPRAATTAKSEDRPAVSMMDFGRELFGNLVDVAVFGLPPQEHARATGIPDVAAVLRVNDPARSRALWSLMLGLGSQASGGATAAPESVEIEGVSTDVFQIGPVAVFLATLDDELVISPSRSALQQTFAAAQRGRSVAGDAAFGKAVEKLDESSTLAALVHPARCAEMARSFVPPQEFEQMAPYLALFGDVVMSIGVEHSDTHMALRARVDNVPDIGGFVTELVQQRKAMHGAAAGSVAQSARASAAPAPVRTPAAKAVPAAPHGSADPERLRATFDRQACEEHDREAALFTADELFAAVAHDAQALNNFAWELLTEERYGNAYDELALRVSTRSNEQSDHDNWYYLDTLALAHFRTGNVQKAVELQEEAAQRAAGNPGAEEVAASLKRYREALEQDAVRRPGS